MLEPTRREAGQPYLSSVPNPPAPRPAPPRADPPPDPVTLAAHRLAHRLNNDFALPVGVLELLAAHTDLPPHLLELVHDARQGAMAAARHVDEFQRLL